ncbi:MAG: peptidylprolyl isomerase [Nitratireductor sp.]|nr:peptidylprolyl isomerase [Nitratireductor sp.]
MLIGLMAVLAGCNAGTKALDPASSTSPKSGSNSQAVADPAQQDGEQEATQDNNGGAKILREPSTVSRKGNYIVVVVNGQPITSYDIQRRGKFRTLRRLKANKDEATKELIDQTIKLQEAANRGTRASDGEVDQAFANFAASNKSSPAKIAGDLDRFGVGAKHFKEFIRTQMSWNRTIGSKLRAETRDKTQGDALFQIRKSGSQKPTTTEYTLQQIIFVIPAAKRKELLKARKAEAIAFAQRFTGCDASFEMAKGLRDVAVKDLGRMMLPEIPQGWTEDVQKSEVGKAVGPKESEFGIELLAICNAKQVDDDRAAQVVSQSNSFGSLEEKSSTVSDELLNELRKSAVIVYK